jgi:hypothetical protein
MQESGFDLSWWYSSAVARPLGTSLSHKMPEGWDWTGPGVCGRHNGGWNGQIGQKEGQGSLDAAEQGQGTDNAHLLCSHILLPHSARLSPCAML